MARRRFLDTIRFLRGFILARPKIDEQAADYATSGSRNVLFIGKGKARPFKGLELVAAKDGGIVSEQVNRGIGALTDKPL